MVRLGVVKMADARSIPGGRGTTRFGGRYLSVTTYRRDGTAVRTPVWFVEEGGRLLAQTEPTSGKVKRIRANSSVGVALCSARGRLKDVPHPAHAEIVEGQEVMDRIEALIKAKYRMDLLVIGPLRWVQERLHIGRQRGAMVGLVITPE